MPCYHVLNVLKMQKIVEAQIAAAEGVLELKTKEKDPKRVGCLQEIYKWLMAVAVEVHRASNSAQLIFFTISLQIL